MSIVHEKSFKELSQDFKDSQTPLCNFKLKQLGFACARDGAKIQDLPGHLSQSSALKVGWLIGMNEYSMNYASLHYLNDDLLS